MDEKLYKNFRLGLDEFPALKPIGKITAFTSSFEKTLGPNYLLNKQMEPMFSLVGKINSFSNNLSKLDKIFKPYKNISKIGLNISRIAKLPELINPFPEITKFSKYVSLVSKCQSSDWIPHRTTPFEQFSSPHIELEETQNLIEKYYKENWAEIKSDFANSFLSYSLDEVAISEILKVLELHENGDYRLVPLSVFPSLESLVRKHVEQKDIATVTSMKCARDLASTMYISDLNEFDHGMFLFKIFDEHVFENMNDASKLEELKKTDIPNRHAALHGYISYNSLRSSINTLIIADFILFIISQISKDTA